ncbi:hypothetical protein SKAU_G00056510 [Synaphobranchus kaupii]|uniref:Translocon-associated protein subunit alpha n=1 Tax=Synaphobranchus kaupii TaxID=118154 RepID=A0A9Q1G4I5_SYNKA|nr:hypothetical protein SKAU_G00056510 [Synaphobranchus kaupii]
MYLAAVDNALKGSTYREKDHRTHNTVLVERACEEKRIEFGEIEQQIKQKIQERIKKVEEVKQAAELSKSNAQKEIENSVQVFTALAKAIERSQSELVEQIKEKQKAAEEWAKSLIEKLERETAELMKQNTELKQLSQSEDYIRILRSFPSLCSISRTKNLPDVTVYADPCLGTVRKMLLQLEELITEEEKRFSTKDLERIQEYADDVTLDPDTAHPCLVLSSDKKNLLPTTIVIKGQFAAAQDATEDEEVAEDVIAEDEDDEAEVEDDDNTELTEEKEEEEEEDVSSGEVRASPHADTTILFITGEVKFLLGFTNKGSEEFVVESLDASFRYPQDFQFYIQNFTALQLGTIVAPQRQATFEYSFIPAEPMGGRPFGLVINLNYKDSNGNVFQDAVFNQTVTITEREDGLDGETIFLYVFLSGLGLLVVVGLHQLLESRKRRRPAAKVEMGTSHNDVDMSWIPQETLNQINKASPRRSPRKRAQKRSAGSDE